MIQHEMERLGRLLAYDRDLKVDVRGTRAYSTPGRVVIPNAAKYEHLGDNAERMLHALLDHECGHAKHTEHAFMERAHKHGGSALHSLVNGLEDGRVERLMGNEYIGCRQNLHAKNRWFWEDEKWRAGFLAKDAWGAFCVAVTLHTRGSVSLAEIDAARPEIGSLLRVALSLGVDRAAGAASTAEVYRIALEVWEHFKQPPPPPPEASDDESDENTEAEDTEAEDTEAEDTEAEDTEAEDTEAEDTEAEDTEGDDTDGAVGEGDDNEAEDSNEAGGDEAEDSNEAGDDDGDAAEGGVSDGGRIDPYAALRALGPLDSWSKANSVVDPEEAICTLMEQSYEGQQQYRVFSHEFDIERDFYAHPLPASTECTDTLEEIEHDAIEASSALTQAFEVALRARREKRPVGGNDEGEVDLDLMGEYATGSVSSDTIYQQFISEDDRDVTVAIMLDCSGSMYSRSRLARRTAYALHLALEACSIQHEITGFTTISSADFREKLWTSDRPELGVHFAAMRAAMIEAEKHGVNPMLFAREMWRAGGSSNSLALSPLFVPTYAVFKPYGVSDMQALKYAQGIHENLDGEAVLWQARRLASRPEKRRVMFVLSDGMPAGTRDSRLGVEHLKESVQHVLDAGIEVYGIGIETTAVQHFYPRHWVANSIDELMAVAFASFAQVLTEGRSEVECVNL